MPVHKNTAAGSYVINNYCNILLTKQDMYM